MTMANTPHKILVAATKLFAEEHFDSVSIKRIASLAGVNSALISYYFGGKKKLYQEVLNDQANIFLKSIEEVSNKKDLSAKEKINLFVKAQIKIQLSNTMTMHIVYRELLTPTEVGSVVIQKKFFKIYEFLFQMVKAAIEEKSFKQDLNPQQVTHTLESMIVFYLLARAQIKISQNLSNKAEEEQYVNSLYESYLNTIEN